MKLTVDFKKLTEGLSYVGNISNSQTSLDSNKVVVFVVSEEKLSIFGMNATIGAITDIERGDFTYESDNEEGVNRFQVRTKELLGFLSTFAVGDRTYPTDVEMQLERNRLNLTVHEEPYDEQPSYLKNSSHLMFELNDVTKAVLEAMDIPDGTQPVQTEFLQLYFDTMLPLLTQGDSSMNNSKLHFSDEYVYVATSRTHAFQSSKALPETMQGINIAYAGLALLKQLCSEFEQISVLRDDATSRLLVTAGNTRMAIKFNRKLPPYKQFLETLSHDNYFVIDRYVLSSILRRLKLLKDKTRVKINLEENILEIGNSRFNQSIPLIESQGEDIKDFSILVVTEMLEDALLGSGLDYEEEVKVSITKDKQFYSVSFSNENEGWFSVIRVQQAKG